MHKRYFLYLFFLIYIISCRTYTIPDDDLKSIPYNGNEILYFKSDSGDIDSIELMKPDRYFYDDPDDRFINFNKIELYDLDFTHSHSNLSDSSKGVIVESPFVRLQRVKNNKTYIELNIKAKNAELNPEFWMTLDDYKKLPVYVLTTRYGTLIDVVTIIPERNAVDNPNDPNYITKVYWSKSKGLVRYDKKDCYWELEKIEIKK